MRASISVIIPVSYEPEDLSDLVWDVGEVLPGAEVIVVSYDSTEGILSQQIVHQMPGVTHLRASGHGAAVKKGANAASGEILLFMDGDDHHQPRQIPQLLGKLYKGYDMVVGTRTASGQFNAGRFAANTLFNKFATWMVGHPIPDLTSGFRIVWADKFREFTYLLPEGHSYSTTITLSFFRAGYSVGYVDTESNKPRGSRNAGLTGDMMRFIQTLYKIGTLYSPLKLFVPISLLLFGLGVSYYAFTFLAYGRFTNMSVILMTVSIIIFLIGLISEQITVLTYSRQKND